LEAHGSLLSLRRAVLRPIGTACLAQPTTASAAWHDVMLGALRSSMLTVALRPWCLRCRRHAPDASHRFIRRIYWREPAHSDPADLSPPGLRAMWLGGKGRDCVRHLGLSVLFTPRFAALDVWRVSGLAGSGSMAWAPARYSDSAAGSGGRGVSHSSRRRDRVYHGDSEIPRCMVRRRWSYLWARCFSPGHLLSGRRDHQLCLSLGWAWLY
jgi:hypothetical protein